ncbi:MAG: type VI secretion system protein TssA [Spirochaetaceae bacterium]|jgi:type VI secretion system protein ImpA|nr:type VI secretion system protein TssA [Spirochaetaceae bacterium]
MINAEELTKYVSEDNPAGPDLEYDPLYLELDGLAVAVPDSFMGDAKIEGRGPDWKKLSKNCVDLWDRTRDLRVAVYLTIAEAVTGGLAGLAAGLKLPLFLVKELWDSFYPRLDPDDGSDPLERLNIMSMLSPPAGSVNDPVMFIPQFRETRLVPSLRYTLRDLLISLNLIEAVSDTAIEQKLLRAEFVSVSAAEIDAQYALAQEVKALILALCSEMNAKMGSGNILDMSALNHEIDRLIKFYDSCKPSSLVVDGPAAEEGAPEAGSPSEAAPLPAQQQLALLSFQVSSRSQALLMLKKGAEYFKNQEPNSPIPLLVNRALRFSEMSFIELIEDIMPDALPRGRDILGVKEENKNA